MPYINGGIELSLSTLKKKLSSINEIIYADSNECLREKTSNPVILKAVLAEAENILTQLKRDPSHDKDDLYLLYGTIGNLYRIYGEPKTAIYYLEYNLNMSKEDNEYAREVVSLIRLGEALKYDHNHTNAMELFNKALIKCSVHEIDLYEDFALQHKGKCLLELNRIEEAFVCFERALEIKIGRASCRERV